MNSKFYMMTYGSMGLAALAAAVCLAPANEGQFGTQQGFIGSSPLKSIVHKAGHEGAIEIDPITGNILTLAAERPEWAEELTVAQMAERHSYYSQALSTLWTAPLQTPEIIAFEDVCWLAVRADDLSDEQKAEALSQDPNYDGFEHYELEADTEFRAQVVAAVLGIAGDIETMENELLAGAPELSNTVDLTAELLADNFRSQEEIQQMEESRKERFSAAI